MVFHSYSRNRNRTVRQSGFTVIEVLVVMGLLLVVAATTVDIFSSLSKSERRVYANQRVQSDVRLVLETIAREIHQGMIDYDYYGTLSAPEQPTLALRNASGQPIKFRLQNGAVELSRGTDSSWYPITSSALTINDLTFYVSPSTNPFAPCAGDCSVIPNVQPYVTITLSARAVTLPNEQLYAVFVQTTLATRAYRR